MVKFLLKDKNGLEVPSPSCDRRTSHVGTGRGYSSGPTASSIPRGRVDDNNQESPRNLIKSTMGTRLSSNSSGSTRMSILSWFRSSDKSAMSGGGGYRKGIATSARKVDLNYDDSDLEVIQSSEQSSADAAIHTRRPYGFHQEISRLRLVLFILLALILGVVVAFIIVEIHKSRQPSLASSPPPTNNVYTPPKPKDELNLWCDLSLLLNNNNNSSTEYYQSCSQACVDGLCCFGDMFDTITFTQEHSARINCYSQKNKDVCRLYKPCENLIEARNQSHLMINYYARNCAAEPPAVIRNIPPLAVPQRLLPATPIPYVGI